MKKAPAFLLLLPCLSFADMLRPYDGAGVTPVGTYSGQQGMTCAYYNQGGGIRWENKGGDWLGHDGIKQGTTPYASKRFVASTGPQVIELDATALLKAPGIVLRRSGGAVVRVAMRESTTPPVLSVTRSDGSVADLVPFADVGLSWAQQNVQCNEWAGGDTPVSTLSYAMVLAFDVPADAVSGVLRVTLPSAGGAGDLQAFALRAPTLATDPITAYVPESDPGVLYRETWDRPGGAAPRDWWERMGSGQKPDASWTHDGGLFPSPSSKAIYWANGDPVPVPAHDAGGRTVQRGAGYIGSGLTWTNSPTRLAHGVELPKVRLAKLHGREFDEAWLTYMVRFENWHSFAKCEGGKLPGLTGRTDYCAGSSVSANGLCGWSLRMAYKMQCDPRNPAWGHVIPYAYPYHGQMPGFYGSTWELAPEGHIRMGEWACIEQRVKVNTPGAIDGELDVYVNGRNVLSRRDVYLRGVKPAQGYGNWWLNSQRAAPAGAELYTDIIGRTLWLDRGKSATGLLNPLYENSDLGIDAVYVAIHNGGVTPVGELPGGAISQAWLDEMTVSERRTGCPQKADVPPPPPPTELEIARAELAAAQQALGEARARIQVLEGQAAGHATQLEAARAAATAAESRAAAARAIIQQIRDLTGAQ